MLVGEHTNTWTWESKEFSPGTLGMVKSEFVLPGTSLCKHSYTPVFKSSMATKTGWINPAPFICGCSNSATTKSKRNLFWQLSQKAAGIDGSHSLWRSSCGSHKYFITIEHKKPLHEILCTCTLTSKVQARCPCKSFVFLFVSRGLTQPTSSLYKLTQVPSVQYHSLQLLWLKKAYHKQNQKQENKKKPSCKFFKDQWTHWKRRSAWREVMKRPESNT